MIDGGNGTEGTEIVADEADGMGIGVLGPKMPAGGLMLIGEGVVAGTGVVCVVGDEMFEQFVLFPFGYGLVELLSEIGFGDQAIIKVADLDPGTLVFIVFVLEVGIEGFDGGGIFQEDINGVASICSAVVNDGVSDLGSFSFQGRRGGLLTAS